MTSKNYIASITFTNDFDNELVEVNIVYDPPIPEDEAFPPNYELATFVFNKIREDLEEGTLLELGQDGDVTIN